MKELSVCLGMLLIFVGCSKQKTVSFKTYPVKVTITQKGQPLADANVTFYPLDANGRGAQGKTDSAGVAVLKSFGEAGATAEGAMAGKYKVLVSKVLVPSVPEGADYDQLQAQQATADPYASAPRPFLPPKYNDWQTTPFECEVKEGAANEFTFDIPE
ncbi:MAG: hypothetical protein ACUVQG_11955 [Thermogutta sp.]